jgi:filamentous hemagglutinin family protein
MSYRTLNTKPLNASLKTLLKRGGHIGLGISAFTPVLALANPTGGQVAAGQASIATPSANGMVITQSSQSAIINWQQFNIGAGQYVQFLQPSSSSVVLNRVIGGSPSSILGSLTGNGQVFLVNTNGVYFGKGASIDTQGFLASSLGISDQNFLAHNYVFNQAGSAGATVVNDGSITAHHSGYVVLAGDYAENDGIIAAQSGHVILASGSKATLSLNGNSLINFAVNQSTLANYAGVKNTGSLIADGGTVIMTADVANALKATVVNNTGLIEAHSINKNNGGIYLTALGGNLVNAGTLDADGAAAGHGGGTIVLKGDGLTNLTNTSKIMAQGIGADGGHVELSGEVLNVRGVANLGKRGSLLLDPGVMSISTGANNSPGLASNNTSIGHIGVGFIQAQLDAGDDVTIQATNSIDHAAGVTAITGNNAAGDLDLHVGNNGHINMAGVDITIKGKLTAEMGYGAFGHLQAGSINLDASHSLLLARAVAGPHGVIAKQSVFATTGNVQITVGSNGIGSAEGGSSTAGIAIKAKTNLEISGNIHAGNNVTLVGQTVNDHGNITAGGNINVTASAGYANVGNVTQSGSGNVTISATGGDIHAGSIFAYGGNVVVTGTGGDVTINNLTAVNGNASINDAGHTLTFQSDGYARAGGNLLLNAKTIGQTGSSLSLAAGGDLTVKGTITLAANHAGSSTTAPQTPHDLTLKAGGTISLDHSVSVPGAITVTGAHLAYTGKVHTFTMSAGYGQLLLDASIGSAAHVANYNVNLKDAGYGIFLQRSIHLGTASGAAANLTATETGRHASASSHEPVGVLVGDPNGTAVILSAAGNVTLSGWNVGIGSVLSSNHGSGFGPVTIAAGKNVSMTGNGELSHSGGNVSLAAGVASYGGTDHNNSILVTAGGNISMTAPKVSLRGGVADANGNSTDSATVTVKASGKVTLTGGASNSGSVDVQGGNATANAGDGVSATADAGVSISGNKGVTLRAHRVNVSGGSAGVTASAEGGVTANATANAGVQLASKTGNLTLTGSGENGVVQLRGGDAGFGGHVRASGEGATATATAHADVSLNAGGAINLSAFHVSVSGGYGAGAQSAHSIGSTKKVAFAGGPSANATFTATNGVSLTAGTGGIGLTGVDSVSIRAGNAALNHASASAAESGHASANANGAITFLTTGNLNITASSGSLRIHGGSSVAARSKANAASYGAAVLNANGEVTMTAAAVTINAKNGSAVIHGGGTGEGTEGAAQLAGAHAHANGHASITGLADVAITATTGALSITAKHDLIVRGGQDAAAGQQGNFHSSTNFVSAGSGNFTVNVHNHPVISYASATADSNGAAALTGKSGVVLTAKGAISVTQTASGSGSRISIGAGSGAGAIAHLSATGGGGATLTANEGVTIKAANLTVTGHNVHMFGARNGARGAATGYGSNFVLHHHSSGGTSHASATGSSVQPQTNHASGTNSKLTLNADTSLTLQARTISLTANGGSLGLFAGSYGGTDARLTANSGATAVINDNASLNITAKTAFTAAAKGSEGVLQIAAANQAAHGDHVGASGEGGVAQLNANGQLNITAPTVSLQAGKKVLIFGGNREGSSAQVTATDSGSASLKAQTAVNIAAAKGFTAGLSGSGEGGVVVLFAGSGGGQRALIETTGHGKAAFTGSGDVNVTATSAGITIATGKHVGANVFLEAGSDQGQGASIKAYGGTATETVSSNLNLTASGTVSITATKGNVNIASSKFNFGSSSGFTIGGNNGAGVKVGAPGGTATFLANDNVNITAAAITVKAGAFTNGTHSTDGNIAVHTDIQGNARSASVDAGSSGAANFTVNDQVSLKASGALTLTAGGDVDVGSNCCGSPHHLAVGATARAGGSGAQATLNMNESTLLQGTAAVTITAGSDATLTTVSGASGVTGSHATSGHAGAIAIGKATATFSELGQLNIVTGGAFTMKAGDDASMFAASGAKNAYASASGAGATATNTDDESFNLSARSVTINAGNEIFVGGGEQVAWDATATARHGGIATFNANRSMNVTAKSAISMSLTGSGNEGEISFGADSSGAVGRGAGAFASSHGGKAKITANGSTNLNVTGTGGTITLSAGKHTDAEIKVRTGGVGTFSFSGSPRFAGAAAGVGGSASANFVGNTNFNAKGAITFDAGAGGDLFIAPEGGELQDGHVSASGGKAAVNAQSVVSIAGGSVTLTAGVGGDITVTAASLVAHGTGPSSHFLTNVQAQAGGTATMNIQTGVKITTAGAFTATAGSNVDFTDNGSSNNAETAASATVQASHGANATATLTATNTIQVSAATIALKATTGSLVIAGGSSGARNARILAGARNDKATVSVDDSVNLTATGNFSAKAGGSMFIVAGGSDAASAAVGAQNHGIANLSDNAGVNIKAGGTLTLTAGGNLDVSGGKRVGPSVEGLGGGSANATVNAGVNLTAAKSATLTAGGDVNIEGGGSIGRSSASLRANNGGTAVETVNTSVSLLAGGNLTITAADNVDILGGNSINLLPVDSYGGIVSVNVNTGVTVKTGGNLSLTATAGSIAVRGGGSVFYLADFGSLATGSGSHGTAGKAVKAKLNTGVDVEAAGSATAVAGTNLLISAGDGALLAVGKFRNAAGSKIGTSWQGGSASLDANLSATFKAGKNLTLTAGKSGAGSLAIDALGGFSPSASIVNAVSIRGGSSHAVAKLNVDGDALVQAGGNITVSVANNMGVYAGSFGDARVDHMSGSATMTATANATLKAGGNITFAKVGGDLTVAGIGVNSSHAGGILAEAAGRLGSNGSINVAVNANALISAGGNITTTHAIGGDIAILAANDIVGFAVGPNAVDNTILTGNAGITGGGNVTLAATGNVSVMGPGHVQASVASMATSGQYTIDVQGKTTVSAGGNLSITAGGNLTVAGGDGVTVVIAKTSSHGAPVSAAFATALASADVSANLHAGKAMTLNVGGNLWIRGGSDADAHVKAFGGFNEYTGIANADANVTAGTNLTIVAGSGATFQGGSNASAYAWGVGVANNVTATGHADLNLTVGGNLTITATGPVNAFGGPLVEGLQGGSTLAAVAVGSGNQATATGSAKVTITAAGNVAITAKGGNLTLAGASSAASFRRVLAGSSSGSQFGNTAKVTADGSVSIKGKAVSLTATGGNVDISAGRQGLNNGSSGLGSPGTGLSHANRLVEASGGATGSGNVASLIANSSVNITATSTLTITGVAVNLNAANPAFATASFGTHGSFLVPRTAAVASPGNTATATQISGVNLTAPTIHITPTPTVGTTSSNFSFSGFIFSGGVNQSAALRHGTANFGGVQVFGRGVNVLNSGQNTAVHTAPTAFVAPAITVDLGELQKLGLVTHIVTMLGDASVALMPMTEAFSVPVELRPSLLAPQATGFTPAADLGSGSVSPAGER